MNSKNIVSRIGCCIIALSFVLGSDLAVADKGIGQMMPLQTAHLLQVEERSGLIRRGLRGIKRKSATLSKDFSQGFLLAGLTDYSDGTFIRRGKRGIKQSPGSLALINTLMADSGEYSYLPSQNSASLMRRGTRN